MFARILFLLFVLLFGTAHVFGCDNTTVHEICQYSNVTTKLETFRNLFQQETCQEIVIVVDRSDSITISPDAVDEMRELVMSLSYYLINSNLVFINEKFASISVAVFGAQSIVIKDAVNTTACGFLQAMNSSTYMKSGNQTLLTDVLIRTSASYRNTSRNKVLILLYDGDSNESPENITRAILALKINSVSVYGIGVQGGYFNCLEKEDRIKELTTDAQDHYICSRDLLRYLERQNASRVTDCRVRDECMRTFSRCGEACVEQHCRGYSYPNVDDQCRFRSPSPGRGVNKEAIIAVGAVLVVLVPSSCCIGCCYWRKKRRQRDPHHPPPPPRGISLPTQTSPGPAPYQNTSPDTLDTEEDDYENIDPAPTLPPRGRLKRWGETLSRVSYVHLRNAVEIWPAIRVSTVHKIPDSHKIVRADHEDYPGDNDDRSDDVNDCLDDVYDRLHDVNDH